MRSPADPAVGRAPLQALPRHRRRLIAHHHSPAGVGFLGSAILWKGFVKDDNGDEHHEIHGLHTAASIWIAAAVGVACGGGIYVPATYTVLCLVAMLRFGPRPSMFADDEEEEEEEEEENNIPTYEPDQPSRGSGEYRRRESNNGGSVTPPMSMASGPSFRHPGLSRSASSKNFQSKASLVA